MNKPSGRIPTVDDIQVFTPHPKAPWATKSGGKLRVNFAFADRAGFKALSYEEEELQRLPQDIRGIRHYTVGGLSKWSTGGGEWHRVRQEFVGVNEGSVSWLCQDPFGGKREFNLKANGDSIWMPPFILHTYRVEEEGSELWVFANTIFPPDDSTTHDTYSLEAFEELQREFETQK